MEKRKIDNEELTGKKRDKKNYIREVHTILIEFQEISKLDEIVSIMLSIAE
jgi:hypothetical protein